MAQDLIQIHSSRSRYEAFQRCQRFGYLSYHWGGKGLQKKAKSQFLTTGIFTHWGVAELAKIVKKFERLPFEDQLERVCVQAKQKYKEFVFPEGQEAYDGFELDEEIVDEFSGELRVASDFEQFRQQQYTFNEQSALVEAFLRVFCMRVLPVWHKRYKIVTIENDMAFPLVQSERWEVIQSATIDVVLQERSTKDIYLVSYKTAGKYDIRTAKGASHDTQGLSETWAFEEYLRTVKKLDRQVMGVLMLYFIKGDRRETPKGSGRWTTHNALVKGYRRIGVGDVEYAHSWFYPKATNESGWGALGKSWEPFDVWDSFVHEGGVGGVKGWLELLDTGTIQEDCADPLDAALMAPEAYSRDASAVRSWLIQTKAEEKRTAVKLVQLKTLLDSIEEGQYSEQERTEALEEGLDELFPQTRSSCHYPSDCRMLKICHGTPEERAYPLENGYEYRVPHHKAESEKK